MFFGAKNFNTDISNWKTDKVKNMSYMFFATKKFNKNLDKWNTANVKNMNRMFQEAEAFNGDISTWDTKNVSDMAYMFSGERHLTKTYQAGMLIMFQQWKECLKMHRNLTVQYLSW